MFRPHATLRAVCLLAFGLCLPLPHSRGATAEEILTAKTDVLGEAALKQPGGPTYDYFAKLLPPLRYCDANFKLYPITLSAPTNPTKARFVSNGSAVNALARQPNYVNETGRPVTFLVGDKREI